jgi:hypothetical protein
VQLIRVLLYSSRRGIWKETAAMNTVAPTEQNGSHPPPFSRLKRKLADITHGRLPDEPRPVNFETLTKEEALQKERIHLKLAGMQPTALCLSGGGIRSAAFCLGAVQALAKRGLLEHFNYLSTVSGGGFTGAWLTSCIWAKVRAWRNNHFFPSIGEEELWRLRRFTSYLTPHTGLLSGDLWAVVMLWLRNILINWTIFFPLLLGIATLPVFYIAVVCALARLGPIQVVLGSTQAKLGIGVLVALFLLGLSVCQTCINLPSYRQDAKADSAKNAHTVGINERQVLTKIVIWALAWAFLAPLLLAPLLRIPWANGPAHLTFWEPLYDGGKPGILDLAMLLPAGSFIACVSGFGCACLLRRKIMFEHQRPEEIRWSCTGFGLGTATSAAVLGIGAWLAAGSSPLRLAVAGPVWVIVADVLRSTVYTSLHRGLRSDLDREWLARLSGNKLRFALGYGVIATSALYLPTLVLDQSNAVWAAIVAISGFLAGPVAALLGKAVKTSFSYGVKPDGKSSGRSLNWVMAVAITVFIAALFMLLGRLAVIFGQWIIERLPAVSDNSSWSFALVALVTASIIAACVLFVLFADWQININRFSMHAVYRNRLVRAFLGTARKERQLCIATRPSLADVSTLGFCPISGPKRRSHATSSTG